MLLPPKSTLFPYTTLFRSQKTSWPFWLMIASTPIAVLPVPRSTMISSRWPRDRKSTRLNYSHTVISYAVFCLKKKIQRHAGEDLEVGVVLGRRPQQDKEMH